MTITVDLDLKPMLTTKLKNPSLIDVRKLNNSSAVTRFRDCSIILVISHDNAEIKSQY